MKKILSIGQNRSASSNYNPAGDLAVRRPSRRISLWQDLSLSFEREGSTQASEGSGEQLAWYLCSQSPHRETVVA